MEPAATVAPAPEHTLHRLEWQVIRRLDGLLQGDYHTLFYGTGLDFVDLREYQPGDDVRHIDWNVTARMDVPFVRQFVEDRELTAWFLLDRSASMEFGPAERPKGKVLVDLVATLARLLTRNGNRVGVMAYDHQRVAVVPPRGGRRQVLRIIRELGRPPAASRGATTDLVPLFTGALNGLKRRSLVFVVSDFFSQPGWERPLTLLARRHELVAVRLWDRREAELPDAGLLVIEDAETGEQLMVDTGDPALRRRFAEAARRREEMLAAACRRAGVDLYSLATDDDLVLALLRLAASRRRRRRRARSAAIAGGPRS